MSEAGYPGYDGPTVTIDERKATIERAIAFVERYHTDPGRVADVLHATTIHDHLKDDPAELVARLRRMLESGHTFGAWKGAQQVCKAAGLEY